MTPRMKQLFDYITSYSKEKGYAPSYEEMRVAMRLRSKSNIHRLIQCLIKRGKIEKSAGLYRSIKVREQTEKNILFIYLERRGLSADFENFMRENVA